MPNYCYTVYYVVGEESEVSALEEKMAAIDEREKSNVYSGCGSLPLDVVVNDFGGDPNKIYCRGIVIQMDRVDGDILRIDTETAWHGVPELFDLIVAQYPSLKYYYLSEEPGHEVFINSDIEREYFTEEYYIDNDRDNETEYAHSDEQLIEYICEKLEADGITTISELDALLEEYNAENENEEIKYFKFKAPKDYKINIQNNE